MVESWDKRTLAKHKVRQQSARVGSSVRSPEYLTLKEAAELTGKTANNISYLIQYNRIKKYNPKGELILKSVNGELRVSRNELISYFKELGRYTQERLKKLKITDATLGFLDVPERERTKHVHRLHPYLGKFIPQLAEYFLSKYFQTGQVVIDPFSGSGTTLVQASEMGIHSIGIDVSEFNVMIQEAKLAKYDLQTMQKDVLDIMRKTIAFSDTIVANGQMTLASFDSIPESDSAFLKEWFAEKSLKEMMFYKTLIPNYSYQNLLKIILSRTIRSCRLTYHYELAHPRRPVREPYICHKHKNRICTPLETIREKLKQYSIDTIRRIEAFDKLRKSSENYIFREDSKTIDLRRQLPRGYFDKYHIKGIFTSPPYVGQIDYHEQHRYAYELFDIPRNDALEIGPKSRGKGKSAQSSYVESISSVLVNMKKYVDGDGVMIIVANDKLNLYPKIADKSGLRIYETFLRPVEDRTERDKNPYSESIFVMKSV